MDRETPVMERLSVIQNWQAKHELDDNNRFNNIANTLTDIKENHLAHIQASSEKTASDLWWIKYMVLGLIGGIGAIITGVLIVYFTKML